MLIHLFDAINIKWLAKQALVRNQQVIPLLCHYTYQELGAQSSFIIYFHNSFPSLRPISWIGRFLRLGALISTSTLRPYIFRDTFADMRAASIAGFPTGSGSSNNRSRSPPVALSSRREPNTRTCARSPASSAVSCRM